MSPTSIFATIKGHWKIWAIRPTFLFVGEPLGPVRTAIFNTTSRMQRYRQLLRYILCGQRDHFVGSKTWIVFSNCSIVVSMRRDGVCRIYGIGKHKARGRDGESSRLHKGPQWVRYPVTCCPSVLCNPVFLKSFIKCVCVKLLLYVVISIFIWPHMI